MTSEIDPKGLIREAFKIDGIRSEECRSIFLDWALGVPSDADTRAMIEHLLAEYGADAPEHPMTAVLTAGLMDAPAARRRGGRKARLARD